MPNPFLDTFSRFNFVRLISFKLSSSTCQRETSSAIATPVSILEIQCGIFSWETHQSQSTNAARSRRVRGNHRTSTRRFTWDHRTERAASERHRLELEGHHCFQNSRAPGSIQRARNL